LTPVSSAHFTCTSRQNLHPKKIFQIIFERFEHWSVPRSGASVTSAADNGSARMEKRAKERSEKGSSSISLFFVFSFGHDDRLSTNAYQKLLSEESGSDSRVRSALQKTES
jgi:hypothetical protein